jgi:phosphoglycerate dehydrogenase-like enzyme
MKPKTSIITAMGVKNFTEQDVSFLRNVSDATFHTISRPISIEASTGLLKDTDYLAVTPRSVPFIDYHFVQGLPKLKGISIFATGVDHINLEALNERGILLSNLPDYSTTSVAEHTIGLMLAMSRRIHLSNDRVRGLVSPTTSIRGFELSHKTLGIIGFGRIGKLVAQFARAFNMNILVYDPYIEKHPYSHVKHVSLKELFRLSDWISFHHPFSREEGILYGAELLSQTKKGVTLINTARPGLVDSDCVEAYIRKGHIRGYAVDEIVYTNGKAADLITEGRIIQTGHSAWYSTEVLDRGYSMLLQNLYHFIIGNPTNVVNEPGGYIHV